MTTRRTKRDNNNEGLEPKIKRESLSEKEKGGVHSQDKKERPNSKNQLSRKT